MQNNKHSFHNETPKVIWCQFLSVLLCASQASPIIGANTVFFPSLIVSLQVEESFPPIYCFLYIHRTLGLPSTIMPGSATEERTRLRSITSSSSSATSVSFNSLDLC